MPMSGLHFLTVLFFFGVIFLIGNCRQKKLCISENEPMYFYAADELDLIRACNIIYGNVHIYTMDFDSTFRPLSNLTELLGQLRVYANDGLTSLGHIFPNLAVIRLPTASRQTTMKTAVYVSEVTGFRQINLTKLTHLEGTLDILSDHLCYASKVNWGSIAPRQIANAITLSFRQLKNTQTCHDRCSDECPEWLSTKSKHCWSASNCQTNCGMCAVCNPSTNECCHEFCAGSCTGNSSLDCVSCKGLMVVDTSACLSPDTENCPDDNIKLLDRFCVSQQFCKKENYKIYNNMCLAKCPVETNDHPNDKHGCVSSNDETYRRVDHRNYTVMFMYENDFPDEHFTDAVGSYVINLEGLSNDIVKDKLDKYRKLRNVNGFLQIFRCERSLQLDYFESIQSLGSSGCEDGVCLTILSNEFLQRLWTPKKGKIMVYGNVSIAHNPRLCQSEIDRFRQYLEFVNSNDDVFSEGNGDRGYCSSRPITPLLVIAQYRERGSTSSDGTSKCDKIKPTVAFNISNTHQLRLLAVYHRKVKVQSERFKNTYFDPAYCNSDKSEANAWKRHVIKVANFSNPSHWWKRNNQTLFVANVSTPICQRQCVNLLFDPNENYLIYVLAQFQDGTIAMSNITDFKTISAKPCWGPQRKLHLGTEIGSNFLTLKWKEPEFPNGLVTHYIVRYWKDDSLPSITHKNCRLVRDSEVPTQQSIELPPLNDYFDYSNEGYGSIGDGTKDYTEVHDAIISMTENNKKKHVEHRNSTSYEDGIMRHKRNADLVDRLVVSSQQAWTMGDNAVSEHCREIYKTISSHDIYRLLGISGKYRRADDKFGVACSADMDFRIGNLDHSTEYKIEARACLSPNSTSGTFPNEQYICSSPITLVTETRPHPDGDKITRDMIVVSPSIVTSNSRSNRLITIERPNITNGPLLAFEVQHRAVASGDDWTPKCVNYDGEENTEVLIPINNEAKEVRVRTVTAGGSTSLFSPIFTVDGVVSPTALIVSLSVGLSLLALLAAGVLIWYMLVFRKSKPLHKDGEMWFSANPDYPLLSANDIPVELELERDDIEVLAEIGHGAFGVVYKGIYKPSDSTAGEKRQKQKCQIAIKSLRCDATYRQKHDFLNEALLLAGLECHHVVRMIGVVSKTQPVYVVMELMENADLKSFLVKQRNENSFSRPPPGSTPGGSFSKLVTLGSFTSIDFTQMAGEVADGMAYLADRKIVHRDLAARNCLVARDRTVKVGDFGLARDIYYESLYQVQGKGCLPVRWMAPESLRDGVFDTNSDVWSFGVLLWEIVTYGEQPYQGKSNAEVVEAVKQHRQVLNKPKSCPDRFYNLMLRCWQYKPEERPTFIDIVRELLPSMRSEFLKLSFFGTLSNSETISLSGNSRKENYLEVRKLHIDDSLSEDEDEVNLPFLNEDTLKETNMDKTSENSGQIASVPNVYNTITNNKLNGDLTEKYATVIHKP